MRIKSAVRYQINDYIKQLGVYYIGMIGVTAFFSLLSIILGEAHLFSLGGFEFITSVFLFIIGLYSFKETFLMMLQNSISRKTMYISRLITILTASISMAVLDRLISIVGKIVNKTNDRVVITSLYDMMYEPRKSMVNTVAFNFEAILVFAFVYTTVLLTGYLVAVIYYRMNRALKIAVSIGFPATILVVFPLLDMMVFDGKLYRLFGKVFRFVFNENNPYNLLLTCLLIIIVFVGLCWLLIRKAVEKR